MRPCDRCGKPVDNIVIYCEKCEAYLQEHVRNSEESHKKVTEEFIPPRDWSMDLIVLVAYGSAAVGGLMIGWLQYGSAGSVVGGITGFLLAAMLTRMLVA